MGLSCKCNDDDYDPGQHYTIGADEAHQVFNKKRSKKCVSCGVKIKEGDYCLRVQMRKVPEGEVEVRIHGENGEIVLADKFLCEKCGDIHLSLEELGFCINPLESQRELLEQYHEFVALRKMGKDK